MHVRDALRRQRLHHWYQLLRHSPFLWLFFLQLFGFSLLVVPHPQRGALRRLAEHKRCTRPY